MLFCASPTAYDFASKCLFVYCSNVLICIHAFPCSVSYQIMYTHHGCLPCHRNSSVRVATGGEWCYHGRAGFPESKNSSSVPAADAHSEMGDQGDWQQLWCTGSHSGPHSWICCSRNGLQICQICIQDKAMEAPCDCKVWLIPLSAKRARAAPHPAESTREVDTDDIFDFIFSSTLNRSKLVPPCS